MDEWERNYRVLQRYSRKAIKAFGFELHGQGAEELPTQGPLFFVSNHQGTLDPAPIVASCPIPLAFISKKENESIPLLGRWAQLIGTIHFDRDTKETYPLQEQLQETYEQLMRGIQKDSRYTVLVHNLSLFESDDVQAKMEQDRLVLTQGDGRGASVSGTLADWSYCVAQVEPKSWLESLFSGLW